MASTTAILSKPFSTGPTRVTISQSTSSQSPAVMHFRHLVAGISGGVTSALVLHPLDLIKIRFQVSESVGSAGRPQYSGVINAVSSIVRKQGFQGLYQGVTSNALGTGISWGVYFLSYNVLKSRCQMGDQESSLSASTHMLVAAEAGIVTLFVTNPFMVAKTRLCLQYDNMVSNDGVSSRNSKFYNGTVDCLRKTFTREGFRGLYKGFVPSLFGITHGSIQFMIYEELKKRYSAKRHATPNSKLKTEEYILFAATSKIIASALTYPYQVVRARLQDQHRSYTGLRDVVTQTFRHEGIRGFFKGLTPYLYHVTPNICIVFLIYETIANA